MLGSKLNHVIKRGPLTLNLQIYTINRMFHPSPETAIAHNLDAISLLAYVSLDALHKTLSSIDVN